MRPPGLLLYIVSGQTLVSILVTGGWGDAPPGGRAGSENDTLLPMTMTCDMLKFWSGPAWRSKVIIRKPWRRKNKKEQTNSDKTIRHSRREAGNA